MKLARLVDTEGLSPNSVRELEEITLSTAPEVGERQEISSANLVELLRPIVASERQRSGGKVYLVIPKSVIVDTIKREITAEMVRSELLQAWQPLCGECRFELEALSLPNISGIRDWTMKIKADLPRGGFSVPVEIVKQDGTMVPAWINGRLITKKRMPVAKRLLSLGERLKEEDIAWEFRDTSFAVDGAPLPGQIDGKRIRQGVRSGEILWSGLIEKEKAIRRGDSVQIKSNGGDWEVSLNVVAQQDAEVGDVVNLKYGKTGTQLTGMVTGQGEVELR